MFPLRSTAARKVAISFIPKSSEKWYNSDMKTMSMPSANSAMPIAIEKILDEELADKCGLYARVNK